MSISSSVEATYNALLRYVFAKQFVVGRTVLDIGCDTGLGSAHLATTAAQVHAFDIDADAIRIARERALPTANVTFTEAGAFDFLAGCRSGTYDVVTAFGLLEHLADRDQQRLLAELKRVLAPNGMLLLSTPDKHVYSDATLEKNLSHVRELYRHELESMLRAVFPYVRIFEQAAFTGTAIFTSGDSNAPLSQIAWTDLQALEGLARPSIVGAGMELVAVASLESIPESSEPAVLVDLAKMLLVEPLAAARTELQRVTAEANALTARVAELEAAAQELSACRRKLASYELIVDRVVLHHASHHEELTRLRRLESETELQKTRVETLEEELSIQKAEFHDIEAFPAVQAAMALRSFVKTAARVRRRLPHVAKK